MNQNVKKIIKTVVKQVFYGKISKIGFMAYHRENTIVKTV